MNCTPFVRQYDILFNRWGDFICQKEYRTSDTRWNSKKSCRSRRRSVDILLSIAQLPRATFYYHLKRMKKSDKHEAAKEEIAAIYHENRGRYGYCRITAELRNRNLPQNQGKAEGLAACDSQTTSPFGSLNSFCFEILSNFWGSLHFAYYLFLFYIVVNFALHFLGIG